MITLLCFFHHMQIFFKLCFLRIGSTINSLKHLILFTSAPVSSCKACKFECFYRFCAHQVRSCTKICKFSLWIEADYGIFRKVFDQFHFIWFIFFFKICDCFRSWHCILFNWKIFFNDFLHLSFDLFQVFCYKRSLTVNIIIESVFNWRSDRKFCIRIQSLDRLCHNVRCCVTECTFSFFIIECKNVQLTVFVDHSS